MVDPVRRDIALLYRRAGFGLTGPELDQLAPAGYDSAVEGLIAGLTAGQPAAATPPPPTFSAGPLPATRDAASAKAHNQAVASDVAALQSWWMDRMIASPQPLAEKLALYWHGHFATGVSKVRDARLMYMQNELFRSQGAGPFEALMQAVAKDGAMMIWLDTSTDKASHPNENFAREMMELFTLGIGNYTQDDVVAAAKGFTGWVYNRRDYRYVFVPSQHDYSTKTYLGQTGPWNGEDIVHIAVTRPESARFLAARIWSHFAYPITTTDKIVDDLVGSYSPSGPLTTLLRAVFSHPQFRSDTTRYGLVKQPVEWLAGAARALHLDASLARTGSGQNSASSGSGPHRQLSLPAMATALGQTLFNPPNVGGWGQNGYWLDTATSSIRLKAALALAAAADLSALAGQAPAARPAAVADLLGLDGWGPTTAAALAQVADNPAELVALALNAPEYVVA